MDKEIISITVEHGLRKRAKALGLNISSTCNIALLRTVEQLEEIKRNQPKRVPL